MKECIHALKCDWMASEETLYQERPGMDTQCMLCGKVDMIGRLIDERRKAKRKKEAQNDR